MRTHTRTHRSSLATAVVAILAWVSLTPPPALAQLGSLIVTVTSPTSGSVVRDTIPFSASVSIIGSLTVARVDFYVAGSFIGSDSSGPSYSVLWNTRMVGNGSRTLTAVARDMLGVGWSSNPVTVTVANDTTPPSVTINQAAGQADPTSSAPILFTAVFSEAVSGFTGSDVVIGGTAGGTKTVTVSGGPSTYTVAVSGMTTDGTVLATIPAGKASDAAGNANTASTSTDNAVTFTAPDTTAPAVTINQAAGQADPTSASPILFTAVFSEAVSGFTGSDVAIGGTAGGTKTVTVSGGPSTYTVAVSGMTTDGTVLATIPAGRASDGAGNGNTASTSTDNVVTFNAPDTTAPSVTINQTATQADPTSSAPILFTAVFSEPVSGFIGSDVVIGGTAGGTKAVSVSGGPSSYTVAVSGMTTDGTVSATIPAGRASDGAGNGNTASTSTDNTVMFTVPDTTPPSVTINQAAGQADPTSSAPILFTAVFSEPVSGFTGSDVTIGGTAGGTKTVTVSGGPSSYTVAVSGMTTDGTVSATIPAGRASDGAGNGNTASTSTDNTVTFTVPDTTPPSVTINQAATQADPTSSAPILFTAVFSEPVSGFTGSDVVIGGTAGGTKTVTVSGGPTSYTVAVSGMTTDGTVLATIPAGMASDGAGNPNTASTSTDNTVTFRADTTVTRFEEGAATYTGTWFAVSDAETGVTSSNGIVGASRVAGSTSTFTFTGTGISWIGFPCELCGIANVYLEAGTTPGTTPVATVDTFAATRPSTTGALWTSPALASGTYTLRIEVTDTKNPSSGDFFIVVDAFDVTGAAAPPAPDTTAPSVSINQAADQADPTSSAPILFTAVFSEAVSGFTGSDVAIGGTAGGTKTVTVSGGPSSYTVAVSGMTTDGTVSATIPAGVASDAAGNPNTASTSTDNAVTFNLPDTTAPTVTIDHAATQTDPTSSAPILFTAVFSEAVSGFTGSDVTISGTAGGTKTVTVSGGPSTYTVAVSGMTTDGTVSATIPAGVASDGAGNGNTASTSTDNTVTFSADTTVTRFEEGAAIYTGTWSAVSDAETGVASSNGIVGASSVAGSTSTFTFTGIGISWIGFPCEVCGTANVYLAAGTTPGTTPVATVDTFAATRPPTTGALWTSPPLASGTYTLSIEVTDTKNPSSGDFFIVVDAFDVTSAAPTPAP